MRSVNQRSHKLELGVSPGGTPSTSNVRNPTGITYTATGPYTVSLTVTNAFGPNLKTVTNYITVAGAPSNAFTQTAPAPNTTIPVSQTDLSLFQFSRLLLIRVLQLNIN
ncbi:MAG: hypothetical protein IPG09_18215 [Ignavibacteria bacterium]|nr:hypothetical protein [Ignavibacteria bacterium]